MYIITAIVVLVLGLLVYIAVKFNARANPVPTKTTHNAVLEIAWTLLPVLILVLIAVPSFRLLFFEQNLPPADLTVKAIGNQWNWTYQYPDNGNFEFTSIMLQDEERKGDQPRLLAVNEPMLVPVNKVVRVQATADPTGVIHSFTVPAFGFKIDAVPGRLNEVWFKATREGTYYGQCSELCGRDHAFMPIEVHVVSDQAFAAWVDQMKTKYPVSSLALPKLAAAQ